MLFTSSVIKVCKHRESITTGSRKSPTSRLCFQFRPRLCGAVWSRIHLKSWSQKVHEGAWSVNFGLPSLSGYLFLFNFFKRFHPELCELSRMIRYNQVIDKPQQYMMTHRLPESRWTCPATWWCPKARTQSMSLLLHPTTQRLLGL